MATEAPYRPQRMSFMELNAEATRQETEVATPPPALGGPYSKDLTKMEKRIGLEKSVVAETILSAFFKKRGEGHLSLSLLLEEMQVPWESRMIHFDEFYRYAHLDHLRDTVSEVEQRLRRMRCMAVRMKAFETRSNVLEMLKENTWPKAIPAELNLMIYDSLAECVIEDHRGRVLWEDSESALEDLCYSVFENSRQLDDCMDYVEDCMKRALLQRASFNKRFFRRQRPPGTLLIGMHIQRRALGLAAKIRHLDLTVHVFPDVAFLGVDWFPWALYAFHDSLGDIVQRDMPRLHSLNLTIDDRQVNLYHLRNRDGSSFLSPTQYFDELAGLIRSVANLKVAKKHYRFLEAEASLVGKVTGNSCLGIRRDGICEKEGTWVEATKDHLSQEEVKGNFRRAAEKRAEGIVKAQARRARKIAKAEERRAREISEAEHRD